MENGAYLVEVATAPFRSMFTRMSIEYGEISLPSYTGEVDHKGIRVLHCAALPSIFVYPNLEVRVM